MNWLDVILLLIVGIAVIGSFKKGMSRQVIHLASVVAGIVLGAWFYRTVAAYVEPHVSSQAVANLCGFLAVFCGVLLLGAIVSSIVGKFLRVTGLSIVDHLLGAVFGLVCGTLVCAALLMGLMAFSGDAKPARAIEESRFSPYVLQAARVFAATAPRELKDGFHKSYAQAKEAWDHTLKNNIHPASEEKRK